MPSPMQEAQALLGQGKAAEAHALARRYLAAAPGDTQMHYVAAVASMRMGDLPGALGHFAHVRDRLLKQGGQINAFLRLARDYRRAGAPQEGIALLERAAAAASGEPSIEAELADALLNAGRFEEAAARARKAAAAAPASAGAWSTLGAAEHKQGRIDEALAAYRKAREIEPAWRFLDNNIAAAGIAAGRPEETIAVARSWLEAEPGNAEALSFLALGLNEAGRKDEASRLLDFDRLVRSYTFDPPPGFADMDRLNDALEAHVLSHPSLKTPRITDANYHHPALRISDDLLEGEKGPVGALEGLMREAVDRYARDAGEPDGHPFLSNRPAKVDIYAWAAVLEGEGNQHAHIHIDGYLSGCYYVRIPKEISAPENGADGLIRGGFEVGRPPAEIGCRAEPMTRAIKPFEGLMVMFPAYLYHQTIPFESNERRICIAFDVLPAGRRRSGH